MKEIEEINKFIDGAETVVVEAAHIYADKEPGDEQRIAAQIAAQVSVGLAARARKALLIDNLNVAQNTLNKDAYLAQLSAWGFIPDDVFMETDLVSGVTESGGLIDTIRQRRLVKIKNGEGLTKRFWNQDKGEMLTLVKKDGTPTCPALDALLYKRKSSLGSACVTILPLSYADQQTATQTIMQKAGISIPVANLYFDPTGGRTLVLNG